MNMLNRQRIAPRVQVLDLLERYQGKPLSREELLLVNTALQRIGVELSRVIDDGVRYALGQLLEDL